MKSDVKGDDAAARALSEIAAADSELHEAFERVLEAAETLMGTGEAAGGSVGEEIAVATGALFEASAVRDIVGQRLNAIREAIDLLGPAAASGLETKRDKAREIDEKRGDGSASESGLLNGPQLPGSAASQAEVDALFDNLD
ncbi:MAG: hypothetical protein NXI18_10065 [Alphaproteobacteria bacterium]|nr:hypothetical protein [Alphaproteobacteria bacterium]